MDNVNNLWIILYSYYKYNILDTKNIVKSMFFETGYIMLSFLAKNILSTGILWKNMLCYKQKGEICL
ncbi:hypothetical protein B5E58_04570 [Tyzzerella sp. An114]|nr:hypothetical protein B5E58_04570 [Tyzzerella sp. An114]